MRLPEEASPLLRRVIRHRPTLQSGRADGELLRSTEQAGQEKSLGELSTTINLAADRLISLAYGWAATPISLMPQPLLSVERAGLPELVSAVLSLAELLP